MTTKDAFRSRGQALEAAFFRNVDQALIELMQEHSISGKAQRKLSESTGITNETILDELLDVGVTHSTIVAFFLLPLAQVAWADGKVDSAEATIVLNTAFALGYTTDNAGVQLLSSWLSTQPDDRLFTIWREHASELCKHLPQTSRHRLSQLLVERAMAVATATGGVLGIHKTSTAERRVIDHLKFALSV
jgi:tellurite resistance protein